eukprot:COSAG01_NODE_2969_length_6787_cov_11.233702_1_plen_163_part_00
MTERLLQGCAVRSGYKYARLPFRRRAHSVLASARGAGPPATAHIIDTCSLLLQYHLAGNAVCPPLVAALGGALMAQLPPWCRRPGLEPEPARRVLTGVEAAGDPRGGGDLSTGRPGTWRRGWMELGHSVALRLALDAVDPSRRAAVAARLGLCTAQTEGWSG